MSEFTTHRQTGWSLTSRVPDSDWTRIQLRFVFLEDVFTTSHVSEWCVQTSSYVHSETLFKRHIKLIKLILGNTRGHSERVSFNTQTGNWTSCCGSWTQLRFSSFSHWLCSAASWAGKLYTTISNREKKHTRSFWRQRRSSSDSTGLKAGSGCLQPGRSAMWTTAWRRTRTSSRSQLNLNLKVWSSECRLQPSAYFRGTSGENAPTSPFRSQL